MKSKNKMNYDYFNKKLLSILILLQFSFFDQGYASLANNDFFLDYDLVNYIKSSSKNEDSKIDKNISFSSFGRKFNLIVKKSDKNFFTNKQVEIDNSTQTDLKKYLDFYEGYLSDEPTTSLIKGMLINASFYGTIQSDLYGKFFIEPSRRYGKSQSSEDIIYHENGINLNHFYSKEMLPMKNFSRIRNFFEENHQESFLLDYQTVGCGSTNKTIDTMMAYEKNGNLMMEKEELKSEDNLTNKTFEESNQYSRRSGELPKRLNFPDGRSVCNMYLKIDPFLYEEVYNNEGNQDDQTTITYLLFFLNKQVEFINNIYGKLKFFDAKKSIYYQGLQFSIHRTKLISFKECNATNSTLSKEDLALCKPHLDVFSYLNEVSYDDYSEYCLGYTFTARDFMDGTLGLAWLAEGLDTVGGACENSRLVRKKHYNTGIVTVKNYRSHHVPEIATQLAFAHEIGHSLGASHDPATEECSPGNNNGGNFLMYVRSNTGVFSNNHHFSECSKQKMGTVMHTLVNNPNKFCFKKSEGPLCGNGVIEEGEECDCGFKEDCTDKCCFSASEENESNRCKLKPKAECSPSQGVCCDAQTCQYSSAETLCRKSNECMATVNCTGSSYSCPLNSESLYKPDMTVCNRGANICIKGKCDESLCKKFSLKQCFFEEDPENNRFKLCELACVGESTSNLCKYSWDIPEMVRNSKGLNFTLQPGAPCLNGEGFCDILSRCRSVKYVGPLSKMLLTNQKLNYLKFFIENSNGTLLILFILLVLVLSIAYSLKLPINKRKIHLVNRYIIKP